MPFTLLYYNREGAIGRALHNMPSQYKRWHHDVEDGRVRTAREDRAHGSDRYLDSMSWLGDTSDRQRAMAERCARAGNGICILKTSSLPLVLRRIEDTRGKTTYRWNGTAYVHDVMYSEAWTQGRQISGAELLHRLRQEIYFPHQTCLLNLVDNGECMQNHTPSLNAHHN